jgi:hypothetical protein
MEKFRWSRESLRALYELRKAKVSYFVIAKKLDPKLLTAAKCMDKYRRIIWDNFIQKQSDEQIHYWQDKDLIEMFKLRKANFSIKEISKKLNISILAIQGIFKRHPDWMTELDKLIKKGGRKIAITKNIIDSAFTDNLVKSVIELSRHDLSRVKELTKKEFFDKVNLEDKSIPITFTELKKRAIYELEQIGFSYPSTKIFGKGTYIICGDTHGKHTRTGMFKLIQNLSNHLKADKIIHVGHFVDDDNTSNYNWNEITNLIIIAKEEELKILAQNKIMHDMVRKEIVLGEKLSIQNQDLIQDYIQTPLSNGITQEYFESSTICNLHRHEMDTRCSEEHHFSIVASSGCLCEPHIVYTIKQQDFTDGRTIKQTFPTGYKKYRRMEHLCKIWQQGIIVVHIDSKGDYSIIMCRIHKTSKGFTTSYFDKIITEKEIIEPDEKTFINADVHSSFQDTNILDIEDQVCADYKPINYVNLGDLSGNESINHHRFDRFGTMRIDESLLKESATVNFLLSKMFKWAKRRILMLGNHERFLQDFIDKFPQFKEILDFRFINGINEYDIEIINLKQMKKIGNVNLIHGDLIMMGQKGGNKLDKVFRTFGKNTIYGHCHYPSCRKDCYTIGLSGKLDLNYNEISASKWMHSFGLVNSFEDVAFITNICIVNNKCVVNNKCYTPKNPDSWKVPRFKAKIEYSFYE